MSHPVKNFEHRFNEGRERVLEMFELGREANRLTKALDREKAAARKAKQPYKKKLHPCHQLANQYEIGVTLAYAARKAAKQFSDTEVEGILADYHAAGQVPGPEAFRQWSSVPAEHQDEWIQLTIHGRWDMEELERRRIERFSRRSNGGKKPQPPRELNEALRSIHRVRARLLSVHEALITLPATEGGPTRAERIENWRRLDSTLQQMILQAEALEWSSAEGENQSAK